MKRVGEEHDLVQCPYNVSHRILRHRFQVHLVRCRKSYPHAEVITCPFNVTHRINKQELEWHVSVCPERKTFENFRHREEPIRGLSTTASDSFFECNNSKSEEDQFKYDVESLDMDDENWENDPDVPSYNPSAYVENAPVLRMPVGMTPSERNAFRIAERKRLRSLIK